jgi:hypothetical protein
MTKEKGIEFEELKKNIDIGDLVVFLIENYITYHSKTPAKYSGTNIIGGYIKEISEGTIQFDDKKAQTIHKYYGEQHFVITKEDLKYYREEQSIITKEYIKFSNSYIIVQKYYILEKAIKNKEEKKKQEKINSPNCCYGGMFHGPY